MRLARKLLIAIVGGGVLTAAVIVVSLMILMFSTGLDDGRRFTLFGAIYFEATTNDAGATLATAGLADPMPIVLIGALVIGFLVLTVTIHDRLRARQKVLRGDGTHADPS